MNRREHIEQAYGFSPARVRSCQFALLRQLNVLGQDKPPENAPAPPVWTRSCCDSLPGIQARQGRHAHLVGGGEDYIKGTERAAEAKRQTKALMKQIGVEGFAQKLPRPSPVPT